MPLGSPFRARLLQVLLAVGAVLVVVGAWAVAAGHHDAAVFPLVIGAILGACLSGWAASAGLVSTAESLAASAAGLALVAGVWGGSLRDGPVLPLAVLAACCLAMRPVAPGTTIWPLASWAAAELAVLRLVDRVPAPWHPALFLAVALVGLGMALFARPLVARIALVTNAPWWTAGVVTGIAAAWSADGVARPLAAVLLVAAAAGLLSTRLRLPLDRLLGPPVVVPLLAGAVTGAGISGALAGLGTPGVTAAGYAGVLIATTLPEYLTGWHRLFRPVAIAGGGTMALTTLVQLSAGGHWAALSLLLLLTAVPTTLVAWLRNEERPVAVPTATGCLAASVLFAVPGGVLGAGAAAALLTGLYAATLLLGALLPGDARRPTLVVGAASAVAALAVVVLHRDLTAVAMVLAAQGAIGIGWGVWTALADPSAPPSAVWRIGALQLTTAAEVAAFDSGLRTLEAFSLPLAAGLLLGAGPRLVRGRSWPAWGPGLLVAAVPSALLSVLAPGSARPVAVLAVAAAVMVSAGVLGVRAPLLIGAGTAVAVALGLAVEALLWPLAAVLAVGGVLLVVGARREEVPVAFFGDRLADLR